MKLLMAANWKMFKTVGEAQAMAQELLLQLGILPADREVAVFAPFTTLSALGLLMQKQAGFYLGGQNCYPAEEGAFTGEISPHMLRDAGCSMVLTGHSERRAILGESDEFVGQKTSFALEKGLSVVLCVGETLAQRDAGQLEQVLRRQLDAGLAHVATDVAPETLSIAYEPVWAIGTGRVAGAEEIVAAHAMVRKIICARFPAQGMRMRILYGGSVKSDNAKQIIGLDNVNGVLVGGASLNAASFSQIVLA